MREFYPVFLILSLVFFYQCNAIICPELGPYLENLSRMPFFPHFAFDPECIEKVQPRVGFYLSQGNFEKVCDVQFSREKGFKKIVTECNFQNLRKLNILVHGFTGNENGTLDLKDEILKTEKEAGVLTLDWSEGADVSFSWLRTAHTIFTAGLHSWLRSLAVYQQAASNTRYVGAALAIIIKEINLKYPGLSFHCIGHSLKAFVCGFAGKTL